MKKPHTWYFGDSSARLPIFLSTVIRLCDKHRHQVLISKTLNIKHEQATLRHQVVIDSSNRLAFSQSFAFLGRPSFCRCQCRILFSALLCVWDKGEFMDCFHCVPMKKRRGRSGERTEQGRIYPSSRALANCVLPLPASFNHTIKKCSYLQADADGPTD